MARDVRASWTRRISSLVRPFKAPQAALGTLDAEAAATLIAAAADLSLILDADGLVQDIALQSEELSEALNDWASWIGRPWRDLVSEDSRTKVDQLLAEAAAGGAARWRHLNHPAADGGFVPLLYSVVPAGARNGSMVAFARDLRALSALQQRLVSAQQSMERDYSRLQHVEQRYRMLFQISNDAVLIVDAATRRVIEANPAAGPLLSGDRLAGRAFFDLFAPDSQPAAEALLATVRLAGRADDVRARLAVEAREVTVSASLFRQDDATLFLIRLSTAEPSAALPKLKTKLLKVVENAPDGMVVTSPEGQIVTCNAAFLEMAQLTGEEQARDQSLDRWLGRPGVDVEVLLSNLRQRPSLRLFSTIMRGEYGTSAEVEVSGVSVMNGGRPCLGFAIRNVGLRLSAEPRSGREQQRRELPRSVEQMTSLIGRVSLKDLVREATDVIERMCIETALELTNDNRASAAEMLGLSRQSLYVKLRRYGMIDAAEDGA